MKVIDIRCKNCLKLKASHDKLVEALAEISEKARQYRGSVCGYLNGEAFCDCKYLFGKPTREQTGCCEFRDLWTIAKKALKEAEEL